jgi:LDH2 family malate/lactate/ureidoglycolate dehydrogenase
MPHLPEQRAYVVGVSDVTRVNCPGVIARHGAERGVITLVFEYGGKNLMAAHGGTEPALSTNPLALGIPGTSPLFLLDIATSERALGYVSLAKLSGERIPQHWATNVAGESTTDPTDVHSLRPFGGYKGYGLALAIELLAGVLTGTPVGARGSLDNRGVFMLLLSPTVFGLQGDDFADAAQKFLDEVVASGNVEGEGLVSYPGRASAERWDSAMASKSVSLPSPVWKELMKILGEPV